VNNRTGNQDPPGKSSINFHVTAFNKHLTSAKRVYLLEATMTYVVAIDYTADTSQSHEDCCSPIRCGYFLRGKLLHRSFIHIGGSVLQYRICLIE
jgi:hypothetical protein